ncbi:hypothetical protein TcasGA2_TC008766 [Tribolium castaneum]|uniref:Uncharacterized protein n=1 Tax=Tribolium castaneum TaxID=7070 RepID=D6WS23_TRICA|nr:hypothetical protein TcasGA2_TC008766 [Tribolium castaneum]
MEPAARNDFTNSSPIVQDRLGNFISFVILRYRRRRSAPGAATAPPPGSAHDSKDKRFYQFLLLLKHRLAK